MYNETGTLSSPPGAAFLIHVYIILEKRTSVSSLSLGLVSKRDTRTRMHYGWFLDDESIPMQTSNISSGIGERNFVNFIGIQPNFAFAAFQDGSGQALLKFQRN
jgi:hypothetical protein